MNYAVCIRKDNENFYRLLNTTSRQSAELIQEVVWRAMEHLSIPVEVAILCEETGCGVVASFSNFSTQH